MIVDVVRQRLEGHVDPLPSFAAAIAEVDARKIGVIRVYESADTPHILSDGSLVVREPAQDSKQSLATQRNYPVTLLRVPLRRERNKCR